MSEQPKPSALRRLAAVVGIAAAFGLGAYGVSVATAAAQEPSPTPSTTTPPSGSTDPRGSDDSGRSADDPNCQKRGDRPGADATPSSAPSSANIPL